MNKFLLIFSWLFILSSEGFSQREPMIKNYNEQQVLKAFYKTAKADGNKEKGYKLSDYKIGDTLILKIDGYENIVIKMTFGLKSGYCDYQSLEFSCDSCTLQHSEDILNLKYCAWRKISENKYLSKFPVQTEMQIVKSNNLCRRIIYKYVDKPKEEYKMEYNSLMKGT